MSHAAPLPDFNPPATPGLRWVKASRSNVQHLDDCVGLAVAADGSIVIGDTKNPAATPLTFRPSEFGAFLEGAKAGEFDHLA